MAHKEDQELELEALEAIFENELQKTSDTEFKLKFKPFPQDEEENFVGASLKITYTDDYPDSAPDWDLEDIVGLSDEKIEELKSKVEEAIESSLGAAMVYNLAEIMMDWLKDNNVKSLSMHEEMMKRLAPEEPEEDEDEDNEDEVDKLEEEEWKGLKEKPLCAVEDRMTVDLFKEWKIKFDEEMIASGALVRQEQKAKTGKMFFMEMEAEQKASAGKDNKGAKDDGGAVAYNAALFGEEEDDDLDDLDDDEEETGGYPA